MTISFQDFYWRLVYLIPKRLGFLPDGLRGHRKRRFFIKGEIGEGDGRKRIKMRTWLKEPIAFCICMPWPSFCLTIGLVVADEITKKFVIIALGLFVFQWLCLACYVVFFQV